MIDRTVEISETTVTAVMEPTIAKTARLALMVLSDSTNQFCSVAVNAIASRESNTPA